MSKWNDLDKINAILKDSDNFESFTLVLDKPEHFKNTESLKERLSEIRVREGWIQYTGEVITIHSPGSVPERDEIPLCGEFLVSESHSMHLRQAEDGWLLTSIRRQDGEGLGKQRSFIVDKNPDAHIKYEVDFTLQDNVFGKGVIREHLFRFAGFEGDV